MYNNPYSNVYNPQISIDRINTQIAELEKMKQQLPQTPLPQTPTNLTQNFQISPSTNTNGIKYANDIEEVERDVVISDTPYFSKDLSVVWIKNTKGEIKAYELNEIVQKDEKDLMIESLQYQLNDLTKKIKEMTRNDEPVHTNYVEPDVSENTTIDDEPIGEPVKTSKPTSVSSISKRKTTK